MASHGLSPGNLVFIGRLFYTGLVEDGADDKKKVCKHCREGIKPGAKICHFCGSHQTWLYFFSSLPNILSTLGLLVSVGLLYLSISEFREARQKHDEAREALERAKAVESRAQDVENKIKESSKGLAKALLVLSTVDGTIDSLAALHFFPSMKSQADSLLDSVEATPYEKEEIYRCPDRIERWLEVNRKRVASRILEPTPEQKKLEDEISQSCR